jgi:hypothetical protein
LRQASPHTGNDEKCASSVDQHQHRPRSRPSAYRRSQRLNKQPSGPRFRFRLPSPEQLYTCGTLRSIPTLNEVNRRSHSLRWSFSTGRLFPAECGKYGSYGSAAFCASARLRSPSKRRRRRL